jgi:hypothetical protein
VTTLHFPAILGEQYAVALLPAVLGIITGGLAAATGRVLLGAAVGAGLSFFFYLGSLVLVGVAVLLGAGTLPADVGGAGGRADCRRHRRSGGADGHEAKGAHPRSNDSDEGLPEINPVVFPDCVAFSKSSPRNQASMESKGPVACSL